MLNYDRVKTRIIYQSENFRDGEMSLWGMGITDSLFAKLLTDKELQSIWGNVTSLKLANNKLTKLPPEIGRLARLETLELRGNKLTKFPSVDEHLVQLKSLELANNKLTKLPPEIGRLARLETLELRGNKLTTLPPEIGSLTNLKDLYLSEIQLTKLPPEIGSLTRLRVLNLSHNQLVTIPEGVQNLRELQELYLSDNQLVTIPEGVQNLTHLQNIIIDNNPLSRDTMMFLNRLHRNVYHNDDNVSYKDVLNRTQYRDDKEIINIFRSNARLQDFLAKSAPLTPTRITQIDYLLSILKDPNRKADMIASMLTSTGDCGTPIKSFLMQVSTPQYVENEEMMVQLAVMNWIDTHIDMTKKNEGAEQQHALVNALLLEGSERNKNNKIPIINKPYTCSESITNYQIVASQILNEEIALQFARAFCQTDESGNLDEREQKIGGVMRKCFIADKKKIDDVVTKFKHFALGIKNDQLVAAEAMYRNMTKETEALSIDFMVNKTSDDAAVVIATKIEEFRRQNPDTILDTKAFIAFALEQQNAENSVSGRQLRLSGNTIQTVPGNPSSNLLGQQAASSSHRDDSGRARRHVPNLSNSRQDDSGRR